MIVTVAVDIAVLFLVAMWAEYHRHENKIVMIQNEEAVESQFAIEYAKDNCKYEMYLVVYGKQDGYIVTRFCYEDAEEDKIQ